MSRFIARSRTRTRPTAAQATTARTVAARSTATRATAAAALLAALAILTSACASDNASPPQSGQGPGQAVNSAPAGSVGSANTGTTGSGNSGSASIGNGAIATIANACPSTSTDPAIAKLRTGIPPTALPADFHPIAAVRCESATRTLPGAGEWTFADAQRADSNLADLLAALRLPSVTPSPNTICTAIGIALPPFALVEATGKVINPQLPHNECGMPLPKVLDAMNALPWRTETEQRLSQTLTPPEQETGCDPNYKYEFEHPVFSTPEPWSKVRHPAQSQPTSVCVYAVQPMSAGDDIAVGSFTSGAKLTAAQQTTLTNEIGQASDTPAPACTTIATRFALVNAPDATVLVELDGCRRIRWPNEFMDAAPASLLQTLATLTPSR